MLVLVDGDNDDDDDADGWDDVVRIHPAGTGNGVCARRRYDIT